MFVGSGGRRSIGKADDLATLRFRIRNCETILIRLLESQERIAQFRESEKKRHLASLNGQSISAVERSLAILRAQLLTRET